MERLIYFLEYSLHFHTKHFYAEMNYDIGHLVPKPHRIQAVP